MSPVTQEPPSTLIDLTNYKTLLVRSSRNWDLFPDGNVFIDETTGAIQLIPNWDTPYLPNGVENMLGKAGITIEAIKAFVLDSTGVRLTGFTEIRPDRRTFTTLNTTRRRQSS